MKADATELLKIIRSSILTIKQVKIINPKS
jgi:hypothetical protein